MIFFPLLAQQQPPPAAVEQEPPEEDRSAAEQTREYTLNPVQADKEVSIGKFYFKRGRYKAAAHRFEEAAKWNPGLAEAFLRLGETRAKQKDEAAAKAAFEKYLQIEPNAKDAAAIRKKYKLDAPKS